MLTRARRAAAPKGAPSELARLGPARLGSARRGSQDAAAASRDPLGAVRPLLPRVFTDFRPPQDPLRDCGVTSGWPRGGGSALVPLPAALPRRSGSSPRRAGGCHPPAGAVTPLPVLSPRPLDGGALPAGGCRVLAERGAGAAERDEGRFPKLYFSAGSFRVNELTS